MRSLGSGSVLAGPIEGTFTTIVSFPGLVCSPCADRAYFGIEMMTGIEVEASWLGEGFGTAADEGTRGF